MLSPYWYVSLPGDEAAKALAQRLLLVKGIYELWGEAGSFEELEVRQDEQIFNNDHHDGLHVRR